MSRLDDELVTVCNKKQRFLLIFFFFYELGTVVNARMSDCFDHVLVLSSFCRILVSVFISWVGNDTKLHTIQHKYHP